MNLLITVKGLDMTDKIQQLKEINYKYKMLSRELELIDKERELIIERIISEQSRV